MKLGEIARRLDCVLEGDADLEITSIAGLEQAEAGQLTFFANRRYRPLIEDTRASAILVAPDAGPMPIAALRIENPYLAFAHALEFFCSAPRYAPGRHPTAVVAASAKIGADAHIGAHCFIDEDVEIGRGVVLHSLVSIYRGARIGDDFFAHSHVAIREGSRIGSRVTLQNGVVIGADGFGFAKKADGRWYKILQTGVTIIEDDVEIQANSTVDRATIGETRIGRGTKIDNLVQVGHASQVGEDCVLCGQVALAGSTTIGNKCILAGQVGVVGHLSIGDGAVVGAGSGVPSDVPAGAFYSGSPAMPHKDWLKAMAVIPRLPEMQKTVRALQREIAGLRAVARD
jgi:UDP-3-O-[3-hydroxymyristoyl] glucosamine N-acyltransferase